ncbi:MAG: F0F1 ATP synthase subunit B [Patescibacteria group bacterium]
MTTETVQLAQAAAEAAKESVLGALGVNWKLFIAQLLNFSAVLFVMWKWVYTPLLKIIDARTAKIDKGLKDAEAAAAAKSGAEKASEEAILAARKEAQRIIEESQKASEAQRLEMKAKTQTELAALVQQGKDSLAAEKEKMVRDARVEIAELAVMIAGKALQEKLTDAQKKGLLDAAAKHVEA